MSDENHILKVSFCFKFQKAVKPKRSHSVANERTLAKRGVEIPLLRTRTRGTGLERKEGQQTKM